MSNKPVTARKSVNEHHAGGTKFNYNKQNRQLKRRQEKKNNQGSLIQKKREKKIIKNRRKR